MTSGSSQGAGLPIVGLTCIGGAIDVHRHVYAPKAACGQVQRRGRGLRSVFCWGQGRQQAWSSFHSGTLVLSEALPCPQAGYGSLRPMVRKHLSNHLLSVRTGTGTQACQCPSHCLLSPHNSLCPHRKGVCLRGRWPQLTAAHQCFQCNPENVTEHPHLPGWRTNKEDPISASEDSPCIFLPFTGLTGPQGGGLPVRHLALPPSLNIRGSWKAVGAGTEGFYPATQTLLVHHT